MHPYLEAILLGVIEGVTEFLPISSTGHLLIAQHWLERRSELFNIAIQAGAILAITLIYRERLWTLLHGTLAAGTLREDAGRYRHALRTGDGNALAAADTGDARLRNLDFLVKIGVAFAVTAVLGLIVKALGWELPETVTPVAWALILGGVWILFAEHVAGRRARTLGPRSDITWTVAILVGLAQVVAGVFPGTSRSAAAIFAALLFGVTHRPAATEFAFLVGIPTMFAATAYALLDTLLDHGVGGEAWGQLAVAFATATVTGFIAVKWLLRFIQRHRFTVFAYYRFALGGALLWLLPNGS
jgi:undecaprenyl-diphosphatase